MIQAITYVTYWFSATAKTRQSKPFQQIYICPKTMHLISFKLGHHLAMAFIESILLNPFIKYSGYCKEHTAQCNRPRYVYKVC